MLTCQPLAQILEIELLRCARSEGSLSDHMSAAAITYIHILIKEQSS